MSLHCVKASISTTGEFSETLLAYASNPNVAELRIGITRRYLDEKDLPSRDNTLLVNTPLVVAVALLTLPSVPAERGVAVVFDSPGLTMQRPPRASEVEWFIKHLMERALPLGKVTYTVQPIEATEHLSAADAANTILSAEFSNLAGDSAVSNFFARLR